MIGLLVAASSHVMRCQAFSTSNNLLSRQIRSDRDRHFAVIKESPDDLTGKLDDDDYFEMLYSYEDTSPSTTGLDEVNPIRLELPQEQPEATVDDFQEDLFPPTDFYPDVPATAAPKKTPRIWKLHKHMAIRDEIIMLSSVFVTFAAFVGLIQAAGPGGWRYFVAGGVCAASSHALTTPIDVVKTRKQVDPSLQNLGLVSATMKILKDEGAKSLLAGLGPTTFGYLLEGAIKFGVYEIFKPMAMKMMTSLAQITSLELFKSNIFSFVLSGTISGIAASMVLCPMEAIRIRMVSEPNFAPRGWLQAGYRMLKMEGIQAVWKGINPMVLKQVPYTVAKNVSFDVFTKLGYRLLVGAASMRTKTLIPLLSAFAASLLSCIASQPGDLLLSLVNAHEGTKTSRSFMKDIQKRDGIRGFFVGTQARFVHVGVIVTIQLLLYDCVKQLCGIAATGSI